MKSIVIYDPPMCCSTGVCGPDVDPALVRAAGFFERLSHLGVTVEPVLSGVQTTEPLLQLRAINEFPYLAEVAGSHASNAATLPWLPTELKGPVALRQWLSAEPPICLRNLQNQ